VYQYAELVHWMQNPGKILIPASADIDLTNACDQDCYYCSSAEFRKTIPGQQRYRDYMELLNKLATWRAHSPDSQGSLHTITFSGGGEPTLFKGYEQLVEHAVDLGFLVSMTTNGSRLDLLANNVSADKLKRIGWIGVDLDAADETLYEQIRHSKNESIFNRVVSNIGQLTNFGVNVDLKILLSNYNSTDTALTDIFALARDTKVRQIYFRPVYQNGQHFPINELTPKLTQLSEKFAVTVKINTGKDVTRTYRQCHQMLQFLIFCADGKIYICCENKGNPDFSIGSWNVDDFRDLWLKKPHLELYDSVDTRFCPGCRSNHHNNAIQNILNNPTLIETLYY
jgi:molybdenum cofactor biosynthesis enzyme MoaA